MANVAKIDKKVSYARGTRSVTKKKTGTGVLKDLAAPLGRDRRTQVGHTSTW